MDVAKLKELMTKTKASMKRTERAAKILPGKNRIRLLPGWRKGEEYVWFHAYGQHYIKDASDTIQAVYICTQSTFDRPCAVCDALAVASRSAPDDSVIDTLAKAKASNVILVNALMLDSDAPNTPVVLELKRGVFGQIVEIIEEWGATVLDPTDGKEIIVNRDGKGLNTKYTAQISPKVYMVPPAALTKLNNLDEYVKQESEEQSRRAIAAVNTAAGILSAPGTGGDRPSTTPTRLKGPAINDVMDIDEASAHLDADLDSDLDDILADLP